jgi:hypothetical protein
MRSLSAILALLLAGCAASGGWTKPGADAAATQRDYQDCRDLAAAAVKPEADINQDIQATHQTDWQRGDLGRVEAEAMHQGTRDRAAAIVASCMRAKGFANRH